MPKDLRRFWARVRRFDDANVVAAGIIASNPARYAGIMQVWASMVLDREVGLCREAA
jgi:hypothetical protein